MLTIVTIEWRDHTCLTVHVAKRTPGFSESNDPFALALDTERWF